MCLYVISFFSPRFYFHHSFPLRRRRRRLKNVHFKTHSKEDATVIFRDAALYNMTDTGHVWIVTEQALFSNNTPIGTLGLKLNNDNETEHIRVRGFWILRIDFVCRRLSQPRLFKWFRMDVSSKSEPVWCGFEVILLSDDDIRPAMLLWN